MKMENHKIISVKYKVPSLRSNYILRVNLMGCLDQIRKNTVTIVKAGAGSGKTTLLCVYIKEKKLEHVRWITLDSGMNQLFIFWKYVFGALEDELTENAEELFRCLNKTMKKEILEQFLETFVRLLEREEDLFLILDDFQVIEDTYLLETFNNFLKMAPDNLHLILISRNMPQICLGTLYMEGRLLLINDEDMRLSEDECRKFLTYTLGMTGKSVQTGLVEAIIENANGWIGGAQLMAFSGKKANQDIAVFSSAKEEIIYDYMEKQIYTSLSGIEQQFLMKTAVLSYFSDEICSRYVPEYEFESMVKEIAHKNLFIIRMDRERQEYRYHSILRGFLLQRLGQEPEMKIAFYRKAAEILFLLGDYDECVRLLFEIREFDTLMERLLKMPQNVTTFSYIMQVPREEIVKNPDFAYQYFFCYYAWEDEDQCEKIYLEIQTHMGEDETFCAFKHSNLFFNTKWELKNMKTLSYNQIASMPLDEVSKAYLLLKEAYFLFLMDKVSDALEYLEKVQESCKKNENIYLEFFVLLEKTQIYEEYGEFTRALYLYERLKELTAKIPTLKNSYYVGYAGVLLRQMRLSEAKMELDLAKKNISKESAVSIKSSYLYTLAEWYYLSGMPQKTEEIITSFAKEDIYQSAFFMARLLRYPAYRGKNKKMAESFLKIYHESKDTIKNMDVELLFAGITYEYGDRECALELINKLVGKARKTGNKNKIIESTLMKARFLYGKKIRGVRIMNLLTEAVVYAYPENICVPFWFEKSFVQEVLWESKEEIGQVLSGEQVNFLKRIVAEPSLESGEPSRLYDLTDREREVLQEIAQGKSNKEIAEALCISLATVKTHLINSYSKLGVKNRMEAVNKMNLLQ